MFGVRMVFAKDMKKAVTKFVTAWFSMWAIQGLNLGPPDYESVALTNWAKSPCRHCECKGTEVWANCQIFCGKCVLKTWKSGILTVYAGLRAYVGWCWRLPVVADVVRCGVLVCGVVSGRCLSCVRNVLTARGLLAGDFGACERLRIGLWKAVYCMPKCRLSRGERRHFAECTVRGVSFPEIGWQFLFK